MEIKLGYLRVIVSRDSNGWRAQGLEINHKIKGISEDVVMEAFRQRVTYLIATLGYLPGGRIHLLCTRTPIEYWCHFFTGEFDGRITVPTDAISPFEGFDFYIVDTEIPVTGEV